MVTSTRPLRALGAAGLVAATAACGAGQLPKPGGPAAAIRPAESAKALAQRIDDPVAAADAAWVAGNDRAYARQRLREALEARPRDPDVALRLGMLALTDLDLSAAVGHLTRAVTEAPEGPESGAALVALYSWKSELGVHASTVAAALGDSGLLDPEEAVPPFHRALATALMMDIAGEAGAGALRRAGGWLDTGRVVGPLAPSHERILNEPHPLEDAVDWTAPAPFRGVTPPVRTVTAEDLGLTVAAGSRPGAYLVQAFLWLERSRDGLLQAKLPGFARIKVDGFTVFERDPGAERPAGLMARRIGLRAGWHRLTAWMTARGNERLTISLLDDDGRPLADRVVTVPPSAPLTVGAPELGDAGVDAYGEGHPYWLAAPKKSLPEQALFGRLLAATAALSVWLDDVETARAYLYDLDQAAPESAAVQAAFARLSSWTRLPSNLVQAYLRRALSRDPTHVGVLVGLGRRTLEQDPAKALEFAERATALNPEAFAPHALAFDVFRQRAWSAEATAALRRAAERGAPARVLLEGAEYLRSLGQLLSAADMEATAIRRAGPQRRALLARRAVRRGRLAQAAQLLSAAGGSPNEMNRVAEWSLARGDLDAALDATETVLNDDPLASNAERLQAITLAARGDLEAAERTLGRLRRRGQTSPTQEALAASWGGPPLDGPPPDSWLGRALRFDPRPYVAPLPGARRPRGLDKSDRWAAHGQVQILDRVVDRVQDDGSAISLRHGVVRLQTKEATDEAGEINLPPDALPLSLRTLKPDGSTVDVDRHVGKRDLSFSALAPGDGVERKWMTVEGPATPWGGYVRRFFFQSTAPIVRSELAVVVPRGHEVRFFLYNGAPQPTIREDGEHVIYYWRVDDVAPLVPEPKSPPPTEYVPFAVVTVDVDRTRALAARDLSIRRMTRSSYGVEREARKIARGALSPDEKLQAIFRWIVENIDQGRSVDPAQVLARGRGRRTGLFAAMLKAAGVEAEVVHARSGRAPVVAPSYPDLDDFRSTLVRIPSVDRTVWADMERTSPWLGRLPPWFQSGHYLTRDAAGQPVVRPIPDDELAAWTIESRLTLRVVDSGNAYGSLTLELPGTYGVDVARALATARPDTQRRQLQQWLVSIMPSARLQTLEIGPRSSPLAPLVLTASVAVPGFMTVDRGHLVSEQFFSEPLVGDFFGQPGLRSYLRLARRQTPLLIAPALEASTIEVQFPRKVGEPVEGPRNFVRRAAFGRIEQTFLWDDTEKKALLRRWRLHPLRRIDPADFPAFRDNAQEVLQASRNRLIVPLIAGSQQAAASLGGPNDR